MGPSCFPQRASAKRTPSVISPTAHRSRAWRRQNGGRGGGAGGRLARLAGFLVVRAAGRGEAPPPGLVTTVRSRLLADLVLFVDTPPVALRTCVRYRSLPLHCAGPWPRTRRATPSSPTSGWRGGASARGA